MFDMLLNKDATFLDFPESNHTCPACPRWMMGVLPVAGAVCWTSTKEQFVPQDIQLFGILWTLLGAPGLTTRNKKLLVTRFFG